MTILYEVEHPFEEEDTRAQQSPKETITLILPLEATTVNNSSKISGVTAGAISGATAGVTGVAAEQQRSNVGLITERYRRDTRTPPEQYQINSRSDSAVTAGAIAAVTD